MLRLQQREAEGGEGSALLKASGLATDGTEVKPKLKPRSGKALWQLQKRAFAVMNPLRQTLQAAHMRRGIAAAAAADGNSVLTVSSAKELEDLPFWAQGDLALNTAEMIETRSRLRTHPEIDNELERWWQCAQRSKRLIDHDLVEEVLERSEYIRISRLLARCGSSSRGRTHAPLASSGSYSPSARWRLWL